MLLVPVLAGMACSAATQELRLVPQVGMAEYGLGLTYSSDGRYLAAGNRYGLSLWDVRSGRQFASLPVPIAFWRFVQFSPDASAVAVSSLGVVTTFSLTGVRLRSYAAVENPKLESRVKFSFSPDGKSLITSGDDGSIRTWNLSTGSQGAAIERSADDSGEMALSADGRLLAFGASDHSIRILDLESRVLLRKLPGHSHTLRSLALSPDGRFLASTAADEPVRVWNVLSGSLVHEVPFEDPFKNPMLHLSAMSLSFSRNSRVLAIANGLGGTVDLYDTERFERIKRVECKAPVGDVSFSPTRDSFAYTVLGLDSAVQDVTIQELGSPAERRLKAATEMPIAVAFTSEHELSIAGDSGTATSWDFESGTVAKWPCRRPSEGYTPQLLASNFSAFGNGGRSMVHKAMDTSLFVFDRTISDSRSVLKASLTKRMLADWTHCSIASAAPVVAWSDSTGVYVQRIGPSFTPRKIFAAPQGVQELQLSSKGQQLAVALRDGTLQVVDSIDGSVQFSSKQVGQISRLEFGASDTLLAAAGSDSLALLDLKLRSWRFKIPMTEWAVGLHFLGSKNQLVAVSYTGKIQRFDLSSGHNSAPDVAGHGMASASALSPDGKVLAIVSDRVELLDASDGKLLASLFSFGEGDWAAVDPQGRFDCSRFARLGGLSWVLDVDPGKPFPIEVFTRDYFEPGLMTKIWKRQELKPQRPFLSLNRALPVLSIQSATVEGDVATVAIRVTPGVDEYVLNGKKVSTVGMPIDLRVFRDQRLVAQIDGPLDSAGGSTKTFKIALAHNGDRPVEISAYCFNQDRVKSETASRTIEPHLPKKVGRAYIVTVGVDRYARPELTLNYAASDASAFQTALTAGLASTYPDLVAVPLVSDSKANNAQKLQIREALDRLSGRSSIASGEEALSKLKKATPDDLVIVTWSGHGISGANGLFYLVPSDVPASGDIFSPAFLGACVSTDELSEWLRGVDAGEIVVVIDACHSAAAVQSKGFKPAPLGSKGLGQLAFDKGIRLLAATQAADVALEDGRLGNGLLTYALVKEGLGERKAARGGRIQLKDWLNYAVRRVPEIYDELRQGRLQLAKGSRAASGAGAPDPGEMFKQRPALFDFAPDPPVLPFVGSMSTGN